MAAVGCAAAPPSLHEAALAGDLAGVADALERGAPVDLELADGGTLLHEAARTGNLDLMRALVDDGANLELRDGDWLTPLHTAAIEDRPAAVALLCRAGADTAAVTQEGDDVIAHAMRAQNLAVLEAALDGGADPHAIEEVGRPWYYRAIAMEDERFLRAFVRNGAKLDTAWTPEGTDPQFADSPLTIATATRPAAVPLLLELGADPDGTGRGRTALVVAVLDRAPEAAAALLQAGADPNCRDWGRAPVLHVAIRGGLDQVFEALLEAGALPDTTDANGYSALHAAASLGEVEMVRRLLEVGLDPDDQAQNTRGRSALQFAAGGGHRAAALALLDAGADPHLADQRGRTPLMSAAYEGQAELTRLLLERGAKPDRTDGSGHNALACAAYGGHTEAFRALLPATTLRDGSDPEPGVVALVLATNQGHGEIVTDLIAAGVDVNSKDAEGEAPLLHAANFGDPDLVRTLIEAGAEVNVLSSAGWMPLTLAAASGHGAVIDALAEAGALLDQPNPQGLTAVQLALSQQRIDIARQLQELGADVGDPAVFEATLTRIGPLALELMEAVRQASARNPLASPFGPNPFSNGADAELAQQYAEHHAKHLRVAKSLLEAGAGPDALRFIGNGEPKTAAEVTGYREQRSRIIAGGDIDGLPLEVVPAHEGRGITALMLAAQEADFELVGLLLDSGADPRLRDEYGWSARDYVGNAALMQHQLELIEPQNNDRARIGALLRTAEAE